MSAGQHYVYDAFISYSHAVDRDSAKALQRVLHRLGRPWYRRTALRVFRDDTALAASSSLRDAIGQALRASRTFVLFASTESAASTWVRQEIALWRAERSTKTFFIVLTDGVLEWDGTSGDFDWNRTTALPRQQLSGWFTQEPLWVDLRGNRDQRQRREFRSAAATVAAAIHDVPKDNLLSEDARQQRRLVSVLSALLVLVLAGASLALWQRNVATTQRDRADQQARTALSRALAAESQVNDTGDPRLAVQLALAAYGVAPTAEATGAVLHELDQNRHVLAYVRRGTDQVSTQLAADNPTPAQVALTSDGSLLAYADEEDSVVTLWNTHTRRPVRELRTDSSDRPDYTLAYGLAFSPDGRTLVADDGTDIHVWDVHSGRSRTIRGAGGGYVLALSRDGRSVARVGDPRRREAPIRLWRTDTGAEVHLPVFTSDVADEDLAFDPTGRLLYAEHRDGIDVLDLNSMTWSNVVPLTANQPEKFALDPGGTRLVVATGTDVELWDTRHRRRLAAGAADANGVTTIGLSGDARTVVAGNTAGQVFAVDLGSGRTTELATHRAEIQDLAVAADGRTVATISINGDVIVSAPDTDHRLLAAFASRATDPRDETTAVAISRHGDVAVSAHATATDIWSLNRRRLVAHAPGVDFDPGGTVAGVALNPTGTELAELSDGRLTLVDARSGRILGQVAVSEVLAKLEGSVGVHFVPDGRRVVVDADNGPEVVDPRSGTPEQRLPAPIGAGFAANPDGSVIAMVAQAVDPSVGGSTIEVWRWHGNSYEKATRLTVAGDVRDVAVSRNGSRVATADVDGRVVITDVTGDHRQQVLNSGKASASSSIGFTADGAILVQADRQLGGLALWGVDAGQLLTIWRTSTGNAVNTSGIVNVAAVTVDLTTDDDGRSLTTLPDGTVLAWRTDVDAALSALCGIAGELSGADDARYLRGVAAPSGCR